MKSFVQGFFVLSILSLSGCLQEPADIEGVKNYQLIQNAKVSTNRNGYPEIKTRDLNGNYTFEDELNNPTVANSRQNVLDPYASESTGGVSSSDDGVNFDLDHIENPNAGASDTKNVDWDNLFGENKALQNQEIKIDEQSLLQPAAKKEVANNTVVNNKVQSNAKQNEIANIKRSANKVVEKPKEVVKKDISVAEKKDVKKPATNEACCIKRPTQGAVLSKYGKSSDGELDDGMTFRVTDHNIVSAGSGKIIYVDGEGASRKTVIVKHDNGLIASYSYNGDVKTALNREVKAGQVIGSVSNDQNVLYFTVRNKGKTIDPESIIR
jgi:murein DD-endopeptidase MepM/ murein hydrolase activator NlpD